MEQNGSNVIVEKTKELCQTIIEQPEFRTIRERIDTFMSNEESKAQFQGLNEKGEYLQHKQQQGMQLTPEEIADFEKERDALLKNPVARGFLDAQEEMHQVREAVGRYVTKTFELGRMPTEEDFSGSCGTGCGCSH